MRTLKKAIRIGLIVLLMCLLIMGTLALPCNRRAAAAPAPKALLVMAFGPADGSRGSAVADLQSTVQLLWQYGFDVSILDAYDEKGDRSECPHYRLHQRLASTRYDLLIGYGHGNDQQWSFCLPKDGNWAGCPDTPQGRGEARQFGDMRQHWRQEIQLAPNAMVLLGHACFSHGLEGFEMQNGARVLGDAEVIQRVNEYSRTFPNAATGARAYVASATIGGIPSYL